MKLSKTDLVTMEAIDVKNVDIDSLTEFKDIQIDTAKPVEEKMKEFADQTNNIYIHRYNDYIVKSIFPKDAPSIDDKMLEYLHRLVELYI